MKGYPASLFGRQSENRRGRVPNEQSHHGRVWLALLPHRPAHGQDIIAASPWLAETVVLLQSKVGKSIVSPLFLALECVVFAYGLGGNTISWKWTLQPCPAA